MNGFVSVFVVSYLQNSVKQSLKFLDHEDDITALPKNPPVVDIKDDPETLVSSVLQDVCETQRISNSDHVALAENDPTESVPRSFVAEGRPGEHRKARMRLRNVVPKNFGHYQLEYAHWLHMSGYRAAKRRRYIQKRSEAGLVRRRPIGVPLSRQRPIGDGPARHGPVATRRPTKLLRLHSSDRPAIKSAGPAASSCAPMSMLRFPQNVVDVATVDAAVSSSGDRGSSDGLRAAVKLHFGAVARIKAGAKCRIMARRWTADDRLEYLVQWDSGIVT